MLLGEPIRAALPRVVRRTSVESHRDSMLELHAFAMEPRVSGLQRLFQRRSAQDRASTRSNKLVEHAQDLQSPDAKRANGNKLRMSFKPPLDHSKTIPSGCNSVRRPTLDAFFQTTTCV